MSQGCLRVFAAALLLAGVLLALLGLVFLLAPGRASKGVALLAMGFALIAFGANRLKVMAQMTPEGVEQQLTAMAAGANGELTVTSAAGVTHLDEATIRAGFERLAQRGMVKLEHREGVEYYVFPGLHEEKMVKRCPYCGNEYPVAQHLRTCPSCGGNLEVRPE